MSFIHVCNKNGTSEKNPPSGCSSWLEFWENEKEAKATTCEVMHCVGVADVGGHVIKYGEGGKEYILPMCYSCNNKPESEIFKAWKKYLVSAKKYHW